MSKNHVNLKCLSIAFVRIELIKMCLWVHLQRKLIYNADTLNLSKTIGKMEGIRIADQTTQT